MRQVKLSAAVRRSLFNRSRTAAVAGAVLASATVLMPAAAQEDLGEVEEVVVTGTRLTDPNLTQSSPVSTVTAEQVELRQANFVEEFIREIPGVVPSIGAQVNNGNGGSTFINLRGLGSNRNITLLNGTRVVPADLQGRTNLDIIPIALVERTDVLTGGAGSTYGADAISGVVNFITRTDFEGFDLRVTGARTAEGDGDTVRVDLTTGGNFAGNRGNAVFSLGYTDREAILQGDRDFGVENLSSATGNPGGSSTTVPTVLTFPGSGGTVQVSPEGDSLIPFYQPFNFNPFNLFQLPLEQYRLYGAARYELDSGIEVYTEAFYSQSTNRTQIAPSGTFRNVFTTPLSNPFLTAGIRNQICAADADAATDGVQPNFSQAECDAAALATDPNDPAYRTIDLDYGRRFVELGTRDNERQTRVWQLKTGARGDLVSNLSWDAFLAYGESDLRGSQSGNGTRTRLQQSLLATDPNACLDPSGGCVPINLFGPLGSITDEVGDFLDVGNTANQFTTLLQGQALVSGDVNTSMPWADSPIGFALGFEFREYKAGFANDLLTQTPGEVLGNGAAAPNVTGGYDVREVFTEANIPLVQGATFAEEVSVQLGARLSNYSTTGNESTWKAGGTWSPVAGFQIRGNLQRVTRAPNINELFQPQVTGLNNFATDPCTGNAPLENEDLRQICLAQGAPLGTIGSIIVDPAGQVNATTGGNPNLDAEDADTWTVGFVLQPDFAPDLALTVDYYNIEVSNAITTPNPGDVFAACFGPDFEDGNLAIDGSSASDPSCTGIRRNPATGNLFGDVSTTAGLPLVLSNQGALATSGVDVSLNWQRQLSFARFSNSFNGNWTQDSIFNANVDNPESVDRDCTGFYSINCASIQPEFSFSNRSTLSFDGMNRPVDVSVFWRWIDGVEAEPEVADTFLPEFREIDAEHYVDLTARVQLTQRLQLTGAVLNLFDNAPTIVGNNIGATAFNSGNIYPSTYDPLGRRFSITVRSTF